MVDFASMIKYCKVKWIHKYYDNSVSYTMRSIFKLENLDVFFKSNADEKMDYLTLFIRKCSQAGATYLYR